MAGHTIFVSYASNEKNRIRKFIDELRSKGIVTQNDKIIDHSEIPPGANWRGEVHKAIESASKVVVVWLSEELRSGWAYYESAMAEALEKQIIVVVPKGQRSRIPNQFTDNMILELESVTS